MSDAKRDRFARMAPARVNKIRDGLRILSNCSNKSNYSWDQKKVQMLFGLLMREFINCAKTFDINVECSVNGVNVRTLE